MIINKKLIDKIYKILEDRATRYDTIYYGDLYKTLGLDCTNPKDRHLGSALLEATNQISGKDYMISSFAISKDGNGPYSGFFTLAERYGRINHGISDNEKVNFWINEMKKVHGKYRKI